MQCFTHRYLGWKINVLDECDVQVAASEIKETIVNPEGKFKRDQSQFEDLQGSPSIQVESVIKPNSLDIINDEYDMKKLETLQPPPPQIESNKESDKLMKTQALPNLMQKQQFRVQQKKVRPNFTTRLPLRRKEHRPQFKPGRYNRPNHSNIKKPLFTPNVKIQSSNPQIRLKTKPQFTPRRPQILMGKQKFNVPKPAHVEISPQQASTEREPDTYSQKKPYASLISVVQPQKEHYDEEMPLAVNTGFHPESVVIEGGFKPILSKEPIKRNDDEGPELKYESEIGVIDMKEKNDTFTSVAKKSPMKAEKRRATKNPVIVMFKHGRNEGGSDEIAEAAAERVESYYLPPSNQKPRTNDRPKQPSNIDIPPGTVVTYDGKKVSGSSLTIKPHDTTTVLEARSSKAYEYIRARPQYVPFKGELPPLDTKYLLENAPQLQPRNTVINRELDTPDLPSQSTKLTRVVDSNKRYKRSPHHTPEHTAEQEHAKSTMMNNNNDSNANNTSTATNDGSTLNSFNYLMILNLITFYWFV